jgi:hypothetical protein
MLRTLAALVSGIVMGKCCLLPTIARKAPDQARADSWIKRYSRSIQNERIDYEGYYLPFVRELLVNLAPIRQLIFIIVRPVLFSYYDGDIFDKRLGIL